MTTTSKNLCASRTTRHTRQLTPMWCAHFDAMSCTREHHGPGLADETTANDRDELRRAHGRRLHVCEALRKTAATL